MRWGFSTALAMAAVALAIPDFDDSKEVAARVFTQPFKKSDVEALRGLGFWRGRKLGDYIDERPRGFAEQ